MKSRLNAHFAACAAVAATAAVVAPQQADAAIVYSGPVSIAVPNNIDGVYMNVVTGATGTSAGAVAGWDINPYSAVAGQFNLWGATTTTWFSSGGVIAGPYRLAEGTIIGGPDTNFFRPGGGTNVGLEMNLNSSDNFLGFKFTNEAMGNQVQYGWVQFQFGATAGDRTIIGYAYEDTGASIAAGAGIPAPGALALLGLAGLAGARRRRVA